MTRLESDHSDAAAWARIERLTRERDEYREAWLSRGRRINGTGEFADDGPLVPQQPLKGGPMTDRPGQSKGKPEKAKPANRSRVEPLWKIRGRIVIRGGRVRFIRVARDEKQADG